jgi:hypothetical protein
LRSSNVPLSDSLVEICVINPKPVSKIDDQSMPEPSNIELSYIENLNDIRIIKDNIADATIP